MPCYRISLNTELEAIAIRIDIGKQYTVCNIYISPTEQISTNQIVHLINQLPAPFILLGDFNARSNYWGDSLTNSHGTQIENLLMTTEVCLLNSDAPTHFHVQTATETCIDLALVSSDIIHDFTWSPIDDLYNSDHYPIALTRISAETMR